MPGTLVVDSWKLLVLADQITTRYTGSYLHLYTNAHAPAHGDVIGAYTEAAWGGYLQQALVGWTPPALDAAFRAASTADPVQFPNTSGGPQTATGYFETDVGGNLIGAYEYPVPIVIPNGLFLRETITVTDQSEF